MINVTSSVNLNLEQPPQLLRCNWGDNHIGRATYTLHDGWSLLRFTYTANVELHKRQYQLKPGSLILVPPGTEKIYHCSTAGRHQFAHFRLIENKAKHLSLPECFEADQNDAHYQDLFNLIISAHRHEHQSTAQAHLWHFLHCIAEEYGQNDPTDAIHPAVVHAAQFIEERIRETPSLQHIALAAQVSPNHLNILFKKHFGLTVHAYLLRLRMDLVQEALHNSDLEIRDIAEHVGIPDLQAFNKTIRRYFGKSPRALRSP